MVNNIQPMQAKTYNIQAMFTVERFVSNVSLLYFIIYGIEILVTHKTYLNETHSKKNNNAKQIKIIKLTQLKL